MCKCSDFLNHLVALERFPGRVSSFKSSFSLQPKVVMESTDSVSRDHDTTEIEANDTVNDMTSPTVETINHGEPSEDDMPQQLLPERKRQQFSYTANELRRRHVKNEEKMDNSGSGFYECNIW